jgi:hypothetical protein
MMANILIAGLAGVLVPLTIDRFRADPAIASSIFVTMTTDSMGFLAFLSAWPVATGLVGRKMATSGDSCRRGFHRLKSWIHCGVGRMATGDTVLSQKQRLRAGTLTKAADVRLGSLKSTAVGKLFFSSA